MAHAARSRNPQISLRTLFPQAEFLHAPDIAPTRCTRRLGEVRRGDLFVAFDGDAGDPHAAAAQAVELGAAAVLTERLLPLAIPQCIVADAGAAYAAIQQALHGNPNSQLATIAVAGTHGKTVTSWLISGVLGELGGCGFFGSLGRSAGSDFSPAGLNGDFAAETAAWLANCVRAEIKQAVLEIPENAIARREHAALDFEAVCITSLSRDGCDEHANWSLYRTNVARIVTALRSTGTLIANVDDPFCRELVQNAKVPSITVAMGHQADVSAVVHERTVAEQTILLTAGPETIPVRTRIVGDAHVYNCLIAAAVGLLRGRTLTQIAKGLESVEQIPGRCERIEAKQPFSLFVDAAARPEALSATLEALRSVTAGRLLCVFGAAAATPRQQRSRIGQTLEAMSDLVVLTDEEIASEANAAQLAVEVLAGCENLDQVVRMPRREEAIAWTLGEAKPGDTVLIAGARNAPFPGFMPGANACDDRDVIYSWLAEHAPARKLVSETSGKAHKR